MLIASVTAILIISYASRYLFKSADGATAAKQDKAKIIVEKMTEMWPRSIKKTAYKPNISKSKLYDALSEHINATPSLRAQSFEEIFNSIVNINAKIQSIPHNKLFNRSGKHKLYSYEKAIKYGFFLNLDCNYDLHTWLKMFLR